jgi:hypothetical protein
MSSQPFTTCVGGTTNGTFPEERRFDGLALAAVDQGALLIAMRTAKPTS